MPGKHNLGQPLGILNWAIAGKLQVLKAFEKKPSSGSAEHHHNLPSNQLTAQGEVLPFSGFEIPRPATSHSASRFQSVNKPHSEGGINKVISDTKDVSFNFDGKT